MMRGGMMRTSRVVLAFSMLMMLFMSGCAQQADTMDSGGRARQECIDLCKMAKLGGMDMSSGPCLANAIVEDWACDVAHNPRQVADDNAKNQCSSFRTGQVRHFVEVDTDCNLIRRY